MKVYVVMVSQNIYGIFRSKKTAETYLMADETLSPAERRNAVIEEYEVY